MCARGNPFLRSGLASLDDLESDFWNTTFRNMEAFQAEFLAREESFRSQWYPWPHDALHEWSRVWEYPYVFAHLKTRMASVARIVDFGSGVTFFPFSLAAEGYSVEAVDNDPLVAHDLPLAVEAMEGLARGVRFTLSDGRHIPLPDGSADAVYSVGVMEHVADPETVIAELARVLAPGGPLVMTLDIGLEEGVPMTAEQYGALMDSLRARFDWIAPDRTVHPRRLLKSGPGYPPLACMGIVLRRNAAQ